MAERWVHYHGTAEPAPERLELRAGPLTMVFEPALAFLRYVRLGNRELVRAVYSAVRDRNWGTVAPAVSNLRLQQDDNSFRLTFDVECREREIDFAWNGTLTGDADGTVRYAMDGVARSTFLRSRIGFCVLHPLSCAGQHCLVEHDDGSIETGAFPDVISPHQPFFAIRAIGHEVAPGVTAEVRFEGDVFEMEDQRNWTDASYKTYCTPLERPYPVEVAAGARISQAVTLRLLGQASTAAVPVEAAAAGAAVVWGEGPAAAMPRLGVCLEHTLALSERELQRLESLQLAHLRVDVRPSVYGWWELLEQATVVARRTGAPLEVALHVGSVSEELPLIIRAVEELRPPVARWLLFQIGEKCTPPQLVADLAAHLRLITPGVEIAGGTDAYFTELNRGRPPADDLDGICYSINPQVHAFDDASLVETLQAQGITVASARQIYPNTPLVISPVTLKPRFNPDATAPPAPRGPDELPAAVDPRQMSLFGAAWTLGSLKYLAESGVASATYYDAVGWRGVMEWEAGSPLPQRFPSQPGTVFPLCHVLADLGEWRDAEVLPTRADPLRLASLALRRGGDVCILVANLTPEPCVVHVACPVERVSVRTLDELNVEAAGREPEVFRAQPGVKMMPSDGMLELRLFSYAYARIVSQE